MNIELNFEQLQKKLKKVLNPSRFRFIIVLYPNTNMIDQIKEYIERIYPTSTVTTLDLKEKTYQDIAPEIYNHDEGFIYINDFEEVLNEANLYNGFNQRRDKIASHNINLICFISVYRKDALYTKALNVIPDLWEFKNVVLELQKDDKSDTLIDIKVDSTSSYSSFGGLTTKDKKIELEKLLRKLHNTTYSELKLIYLYQIATIYRDIGDLQNSLKYLEKELKLKKDFNSSEEDLSTSYNNISLIYKANGELDMALDYQEKALELVKKLDKKDSLSTSYNNISQIYKDMGELEKALDYQKKALELIKEVLDEKHPDFAISYNNLSTIYQEMGELEKALEYQKKALDLKEEILGEKHPSLAESYNNIFNIYMLKKDIIKAKESIDKAVNIFEFNFPNGHPHLDIARKNQQYINDILQQIIKKINNKQ